MVVISTIRLVAPATAVEVVSDSEFGYAIRSTVAGAANPLLGASGSLQQARASRFRHGAR